MYFRLICTWKRKCCTFTWILFPLSVNSKRGIDTRVSLKEVLAEQVFKDGTRGATEWKQWIEAGTFKGHGAERKRL